MIVTKGDKETLQLTLNLKTTTKLTTFIRFQKGSAFLCNINNILLKLLSGN